MKKGISFVVSLVMMLSLCAVFPNSSMFSTPTLVAKASGVDNITARADYLYNLTWTAQANMNGYINSSGTVTKTYTKGQSYRIPYGQPVGSNGFIGYGISIDDFLEATKFASNPFYTKRGGGTSGSMNSNYYSMDCSTFVSYCWELSSRYTTSTWSSVNATNLGKCTSANVGKIQQGDALNLARSHIVLVSRVNSNGTYEITEETPPEVKRTTYSASDLVKNYSSYTIYRYNKRDSVTPAPNGTVSSFPGEEDNSYSVPISVTAPKKINTYDGNGNLESNRWIDAGDACTIDKVYTNGFVHVGYPTSSGTRWCYAKKGDFDIISSDFFDFWGLDDGTSVKGEYKIWLKQSGYGNASDCDVNVFIDGKETTNALGTLYQDENGFFSFILDTTKYSDGLHTIYTVIRNTSGVEEWASRTIIISDNPFFDFWGLDDGTSVKGEYKIWLKQSGYGNASDCDVNVFIDGKETTNALGTLYQDENGFFSFILDTTKYPNGKHTLYAEIKNSAGVKKWNQVVIIIENTKSQYYKGDCNNDGKVSIADLVLLQKWILGIPDIKLTNWKAADLYEDDRLDVFDLCLMRCVLVENS